MSNPVNQTYLGIKKDYDIKEVMIGYKKPKKSKSNPNPKLTKEQKDCLPRNLGGNKQVSRERIYVEHAIGGMKIFRIRVPKPR